MNITRIKGTNMELTDNIKDYIIDKIGGLEKFWDKIIDADVEVGLDSMHHQSGEIYRCEVNMRVPGDVLRVEKTEKDLYKAIDKVKDHLREMIEEKQGRRATLKRKGSIQAKEMMNEETEL
ncbi:MAG: ribosome-associated translation inhibitor RaiA [Patescibacteria group bacterium]|nr:ribosome-associated translation inhibitor RaiA [Patescibacteria group bacterium]